MKNVIGLDSEKSKLLADKLNDLFDNYRFLYINKMGFQWNVMGEKFLELHVEFEKVFNDALMKIDAIAERIRTIDQILFHLFTPPFLNQIKNNIDL
jgi:starvation-inducible DNA-binding protein